MLDEIILGREQQLALDKCRAWLDAFPNTRKKFFVLQGFAGTGKTFTFNKIVSELKRTPAFMAYTGKAALVLRQYSNVPANTIHSTIYKLDDVPMEVFKELYDKLEKETSEETKKQIEAEINELKKPKFVLNEQAFNPEIDLIGLDECSMVDDDILNDLLSFGIPIVALGDSGQLPPIGGEGALFRGTPDATLTEIRRQALDSPIIKWSMWAREQRPLPATIDVDKWKELECAKIPTAFVDDSFLEKLFNYHDVVLCWKNKTRANLNMIRRRQLGFAEQNSMYPVPGETLIVTRNDRALGVFNGQFVTVLSIEREFDNYIEMKVEAETIDGSIEKLLKVHRVTFEKYSDKNAANKYRPWDYRGTQEADFGYAITCHKSQGSQWGKVLVFEENVFNWGGSDNKELRARWLYTAITRAAKKLTIISGSMG